SPMTAPNFCMLLRKHLQNGRIVSIRQPGLERIIMFEIEHLDEMNDVCHKTLVVEIMGKHSNIIFLDDHHTVIDSIKHISGAVSSVREVLPGRDYFIPMTQKKYDPFEISKETFLSQIAAKPMPAAKAVYTTLTGFSPVMAEELLFRASIDSSLPANTLSDEHLLHLYNHFSWLMEEVSEKRFKPCIFLLEDNPLEFAALPLTQYGDMKTLENPSISYILETYYAKKNTITRIRQKSADLRRIVQTALERNTKKYELQLKQLNDTQKKDKFRIYGELLNTYGYGLKTGCKSFEADNYYTGETITIPLNETLSPQENAKKYFDKYNKLKRTEEAVNIQSAETKKEIEHLESIGTALDIALYEEDLAEIKDELVESGYIRRKSTMKKKKFTSRPLHYISSDGYQIYVGKNNYQNDDLTFKFAVGNDWWFHAKGIPGSHVIVKSNGEDLPDKTFEEAGSLAAYYSKGREQGKVEIDYVQKKNIKKPNGSKPGFVVYYTNYSLVAVPDISRITQVL
ncbi:MAG TPA: NFACT RNA binding domain-containing protein, partial [Lachnospiraceae bacterium]|nr:NFACT RNA binding domain-containing protein [Lachnospiraceae bacterium]